MLNLPAKFNQLQTTHRPLFWSAVFTVAMGIFFLAGIFLDARYITGAPIWMKPLKFAISTSVYSFTLLWMLTLLQGHKTWVRIAGWITTSMFALEFTALIVQVIRGTTSHFNSSSALNGAIYSTMGIAISLVFVAHIVTAVLFLRQRMTNPVLTWAVRFGLLICALGMAEATLMTAPTTAQMALLQAGQKVSIIGAHTVGLADGGAGLPVVGWSTLGGDLRIGHFVGMHALQVLPLLAFLLLRSSLPTFIQTRVIWIAAASYLGITALVTGQALRGQPLLSPDALTWQLNLVWLASSGLGLLWALRSSGKILPSAAKM
jgi:hypothetical protein